ncbi:MAG: alanyl-tRNA editing protein [Caldilineales bacterium]|nr:alanyl-tRNA editing protein [Caldilineales bacterium]MCW5857989.1 alanyl-tRNA editing protein [Caldilineales bacterium]
MNSSVPSTHKLYWSDPQRRRFQARVLARQQGERPALVLNRTLFYPTGGGQPCDEGRLGEARVVGVEQEDGLIHHFVDHLPHPADEISGEIDWPRRWDHMQQHSGQHLLSAAFIVQLDRPTLSFHLSPDTVTIDLPGPPPDAAAIGDVLAYANAIVAEDRPIHSYLVASAEAARLPLRKAPTVEGPVRVVEIEGIDWSACGGTHVRSTAAIGHLAVTRLERRGDATRVYFAAGGRAQADHLRRLSITQALAEQFSAGIDDLPGLVGRLRQELDQAQKALKQAQNQLVTAEAARLWAQAPVENGARLIRCQPEPDSGLDIRRLLAAALALGGCLGVIGRAEAGSARWVAGRSAEYEIDLRRLLPSLPSLPGVRGGGSPDFIQGSVDPAALPLLLDTLAHSLTAALAGQTDVRTSP